MTKKDRLEGKYNQNQEKALLFENFSPKSLQVRKKAVPLHRF